MDLEIVRSILAWCALVNIGLLLVWILLFIMVHDWIYRLHSMWFKISKQQFDSIHYMLIGAFKIITIMFFLIPYLVIRHLS